MNNTYPIRRGLYLLAVYRLTVALSLLLLRSFLGSFSPVMRGGPIFVWIISILLLTLVYMLILQIIRLDRKKLLIFTYFQLFLDVIFVEVLILLTGGIESWFSFLLILLTILASIITGKRGGYIIAASGGIIYGVLIDLQYYHIIPIAYTSSYQIEEFFYNIIVNLMGLFLTAFLMGYLITRLEKTSETLMKRDIDLKELAKFQSEVIDNIPSGLFTTDNYGRILLFNRAGERITGKSFEEVKGLPINSVFPFLQIPPVTGRSKGCIHKDGETIHIGMNISNYTNAKGEQVGFIGTFQDVTNIIRMEEEIKKKEKLAAIGQLSASIAHELRNPLASIKSSFEMLKENRLPDETKKRLMDIAIAEMDRLNSIVKDFLVYSNPKPPEKRLFMLSNTVNELVDSIAHTYESLEIKKEIKDNIKVFADEQKIRQVLWNILTNAVDATDAKGTIRVYLDSDGKNVIIRVIDNGCGIEEEDIEKIFYPFFSKKKDGTGLGLAIAYRIIEEHGGNISVNSKPGQGSEFTVTIPLRDREDV